MDAISDVSRASQIFSAVPGRNPLPKPFDLDELLGFNEALRRRRGLDEEVIDQKYLGKSKVFINHVDSFIGKHLVTALAPKASEVVNAAEENLTAVVELIEEADKSPRSRGSKSKKVKSPTKSKKKKDKSSLPPKGKHKQDKKHSSSPVRIPLEESLEDIQDQEQPRYDTSKLTVAEYYEMMDLKLGSQREMYLKEKFKRDQEELSPSQLNENFKTVNKKRSSRRVVFSDDFEIIGTLQNIEAPEDLVPEGVSKILHNSEENQNFLSQLAECSVIIYNIVEDSDQVIEAICVLNDLQRFLQEIEHTEDTNEYHPPLIILVSSFMTWALTKPLNPKEPYLPLIEKDYRKRKPHPNYQLHFDLEEQVIKMNSDVDAVILVCGIPYGHEENVLSYLFEMAFSCLDLPVFNSGNNTIPIVHVENIGEIIKAVLKRRNFLKSPFVFAKDPVAYSMKSLVKAISVNLGTGCYRTMPSLFSFLKDEITQDIYDQTTANVNLESCYPLFSKENVHWKYENGFVENITTIIKEFVDAKQIKPLCILLYGLKDEMERGVVSKLSEQFHIPQLWLNTVVEEYINEMEEKIKTIEELKAAAVLTQRGPKGVKEVQTQIESTSLTGLQECQENADLQSSVDFFKKLNLKKFEDFKNLTDTQKVSIVKRKLSKNACLNYGFVLVNFPTTLLQAQLLFPKESPKDIENSRAGITKPDFIVHLSEPERVKLSLKSVLFENDAKTSSVDVSLKKTSADLEFEPPATILKEKSLSQDEGVALGELIATELNTTETEVQDRLEETPKIKPKSQKEVPAIKYLLDRNENCNLIKIETQDSDDVETVYIKVLKEIEVFLHGYSESVADLIMSKEDIRYSMENSERKSSFEVDKTNKAGEKELNGSFIEETEYKNLKEEEESTLAINSCPLIKYLISYVFPTLTNAILEATAQRPDDPVDFIAEYLFVNNPEGHMMDPNEAKEREELLNKPQGAMKIDSKACLA